MLFILAASASALTDYFASCEGRGEKTGGIETQWGALTAEGSGFTLVHHEKHRDNPAPCEAEAGSLPVVDVVGLSHVDHDAMMGCGVAMGRDAFPPAFVKLAAVADVRGPGAARDLPEWGERAANGAFTWGEALDSVWAYEESHKVWPPREGVADVTEEVESYVGVIDRILAGDQELLFLGRQWRAAEVVLAASSIEEVMFGGSVLLRKSEEFVNHLYRHEGHDADCVVALTPTSGDVTVSFREPEKFSAEEFGGEPALYFVRKAFGPEAGGGAGCAGGPRNAGATMDAVYEVADLLRPYF